MIMKRRGTPFVFARFSMCRTYDVTLIIIPSTFVEAINNYNIGELGLGE